MAFKKPEPLRLKPDATQPQKDAYAEVMARVSIINKPGVVLSIHQDTLRSMADGVISAGAVRLSTMLRMIKNQHNVWISRYKTTDVFAITHKTDGVSEAALVTAIDLLTLNLNNGEFNEEKLPLDVLTGIYDMNKANAAIKKQQEKEQIAIDAMRSRYANNPSFGAF